MLAQRVQSQIADEFWRRKFMAVVLLRTLTNDSGCWIWQRGKDSNGYGLYGCSKFTGNYNPIRAHVVSWIAFRGMIPNGLEVCHACDNPSCCNPSHLWLGTHADNLRDAMKKGRCATAHPKGRKLNPETIIEIHRLHSEGFGYKRLAKIFSYDPRALARIVKNRIYKDVATRPK